MSDRPVALVAADHLRDAGFTDREVASYVLGARLDPVGTVAELDYLLATHGDERTLLGILVAGVGLACSRAGRAGRIDRACRAIVHGARVRRLSRVFSARWPATPQRRPRRR